MSRPSQTETLQKMAPAVCETPLLVLEEVWKVRKKPYLLWRGSIQAFSFSACRGVADELVQ